MKDEKKKKNRSQTGWVIAAILAVCLAVSVGVNAWQFTRQRDLTAQPEEAEKAEEAEDTEADTDEEAPAVYDEEDVRYEDEDAYADVTDTLPDTGESVSYTLTSGNYIVGVHIPEGLYQAESDYEFDYIGISDAAHDIYLYTCAGEEDNYMDDLWLFDGAELEIESETTVVLTSDNAQTQTMGGTDNPLTDSVDIDGGVVKFAGEDFDPGVYDVEAREGAGTVEVEVYGEDGDVYYGLDLDLGGSYGTIFKNLVLPEGASVNCEDEISITLTPSERIESTDYEAYYDRIPG